MDTKSSGSTNTTTTSSADRAAGTTGASVPNAPNSNIVAVDGAGGTDVKTIDMSGTNMPDATNAKTPAERAEDIRLVDGTTRTAGVSGNTVPQTAATPAAPATPAKAAPKVPTVQVRVFGNHTHEGINYEKGDIIEVDEASAAYIVDTAEAGARV